MGSETSSLNSPDFKRIFTKGVEQKEAEMVLTRLGNMVSQLNTDDLVKNANTQLCKSIRKNLGDCTTKKQLALLNFLEVLAARGTGLQQQMGLNIFHNAFRDSKLNEKVIQLLKQEIDNESKQNHNSSFNGIPSQILRIFMYMMKGQQINYNILNLLAMNIERNVVVLQELIMEIALKQSGNEQENQENNHKLDICINQGFKTIQSLHNLAEVNVSHLSSNTLPKQLSALIHINCNAELKCPQQLVINMTSNVEDLQIAIIHSLYSFSSKSNELIDYLNQKHNTIQHITLHFADFIKNASQKIEIQSSIDSLNVQYPSAKLIAEEINLLRNLLYYKQQYITTLITNTQILPILIKLATHNFEHRNIIKDDNRILEMRNTSCECLLQILIVSGPQALEKIMQTNYLDALIQLMLTSIQENDEIVKKIMMYIKQFFSELHDVYSGGLLSFPYRRILPNNDLTIPFTELIKMSEEQIEESGGIEEIEARIIYMGPMMYYTSFDMQKVNTKEAIQNNYAVIMRNRRMRRRRQRI